MRTCVKIKNLKLKKHIKHIIISISAILISLVLLQFYGNVVETNVRDFYRDKICACDTLRFKIYKDSLGVPYVNYFSITGKHIGIQRNATSVSFAVDEYFQEIVGEKSNNGEKNTVVGDNTNNVKFQNCVNWILANAEKQDSCLYLKYKFNWVYNLKPNWKSAMAQGLAVKTLTQAFELSKDSIYLIKIEMFLNSFHNAVNDGGVTHKISDSAWWFEEYSQENGENPYILNGMMYALDALYYNYSITKNQHSKMLFDKGMNALKLNLHLYDNGSERSFYDNQKTVSTEYYHQIHVDFLKKFAETTNEKIFADYYKKWSEIKPNSYLEKLFKNLNKSFVLLFVAVFVICYLIIFSLWFFVGKVCCKKS